MTFIVLIANKSRVIYLLFLEEKGKNTRLHLMSCKFEERSSSVTRAPWLIQ